MIFLCCIIFIIYIIDLKFNIPIMTDNNTDKKEIKI
jgi:hypothetical protein